MKYTGAPIENPMHLLGSEIFTVSHEKVDNHKNAPSYTATIGSMIQYAAVDSLMVKSLEFNEQGTGIIINKTKENITIPMDQSLVSAETPGIFFDSTEKADAIAKGFNKISFDKAEALEKEARQAKEMLKSMLGLASK